MKVPKLSFGEYADMMVVAGIKIKKAEKTMSEKDLKDLKKRRSDMREYVNLVVESLKDAVKALRIYNHIYDLEKVNRDLWGVRHRPSKTVCKKVIKLNDQRVGIKNKINALVGDLKELKF
jgi:hypothetical protein